MNKKNLYILWCAVVCLTGKWERCVLEFVVVKWKCLWCVGEMVFGAWEFEWCTNYFLWYIKVWYITIFRIEVFEGWGFRVEVFGLRLSSWGFCELRFSRLTHFVSVAFFSLRAWFKQIFSVVFLVMLFRCSELYFWVRLMFLGFFYWFLVWCVPEDSWLGVPNEENFGGFVLWVFSDTSFCWSGIGFSGMWSGTVLVEKKVWCCLILAFLGCLWGVMGFDRVGIRTRFRSKK